MSTQAKGGDNPLADIFLTDLRKDLVKLDGYFAQKENCPWAQVITVLSHISSCARLSKSAKVAQLADKVIALAKKAPQNPEALQKCFLGVDLLHLYAREGAETPSWLDKLDALKVEATIEPIKNITLQEDAQKGFLPLFANELDLQVQGLNKALLKLEKTRDDKLALQAAMRAAHSVKGAARVVNITEIVHLAHSIEECFVSVQQHKVVLDENIIDAIFKCVDYLSHLSKEQPEKIPITILEQKDVVEKLCHDLDLCLKGEIPLPEAHKGKIKEEDLGPNEIISSQLQQRVLRVNAETLNRLMGLAGEALVETRWLPPFSNALIKIKREQIELASTIDVLRVKVEELGLESILNDNLNILLHKSSICQQELNKRLAEFEMFSRRYSNIAERLYHEVIESRMRPFSDVAGAFPRMIRDIAKQLHKKVRFEMRGENTPVDREILEKMEAPLTHLLRNAMDHGIETPEERLLKGKSEEGIIILSAQHRAGMLAIEITDDGVGVKVDVIKKTILEKQLATPEMLANLSLNELYDFMMLPGFSTTTKVTEMSGRGVGLSVVQTFIHEVGGRIQFESKNDQGLKISMILPLTLSVVRALLVQIAGEPYALPLAKIDRVLFVDKSIVSHIEQRPFFNFMNKNIGIVSANDVLELENGNADEEFLSVVLIGDAVNTYGIVVEKFIGEKELVVQELDPLLGKVPNISAGAFMEDGAPILILDVEDLMRSIDMLLSGGRMKTFRKTRAGETKVLKKRILVVDDSITVREVESRLLENQGYEVETAVNGMDGWNALRTSQYDLVITDVDMPRMNGIDFVRTIRSDPRYKELPVMIVSYKEREEDRIKGLDAGANYYLTKSSFHDETLVKAVRDLIGDPYANSEQSHANSSR